MTTAQQAAPSAPAWFVVIAKQNQDLLAARGLREQGFEVYVPRKFERERVGHSMKPIAQLRLSPYFFVRFDRARGEGGPVKNTRGVEDLPCNADGVPRLFRNGEAVIASLRQREDDEFGAALPKRGRTDIEPGDKVRIDSKAHRFNGQEGLLTAIVRGIATIITPNGMAIECGEADLLSLEVKPEPKPKKPKKPKKGKTGK